MSSTLLEKMTVIVRELPSLPAVAQEVLHQLSVPGAHPATLQNTMSRDPALTLRVLGMANSAYYRRGREITSLSDAIVLLGFKTIQSLVLSSAVHSILGSAGAVAPKLWEHCFAVAISCREIAAKNGLSSAEKEEAFLAGLFHDVAKGVIASRFTGIYDSPKSIFEERELLGFDHAQLGQVLLSKWEIPNGLVQAVGSHHSGTGSYASLIELGNCVAEPIAGGVAHLPRVCTEELLSVWSIKDEDIETLRERVESSISEQRSISR